MADDANEATHPGHSNHADGSGSGADPTLCPGAYLCDLLDSLWGGVCHFDLLLLVGGTQIILTDRPKGAS